MSQAEICITDVNKRRVSLICTHE